MVRPCQAEGFSTLQGNAFSSSPGALAGGLAGAPGISGCREPWTHGHTSQLLTRRHASPRPAQPPLEGTALTPTAWFGDRQRGCRLLSRLCFPFCSLRELCPASHAAGIWTSQGLGQALLRGQTKLGWGTTSLRWNSARGEASGSETASLGLPGETESKGHFLVRGSAC